MNVSRRRYMGEKGGSIPYPIVEYLQASAICRIDVSVNGNARIVGKAVSTREAGNSQVLICSTPQGRGGTFFGEVTTTRHWGLGSAEGTYSDISMLTSAEFDLEFYSGGASGTINGQSVSRTSQYQNQNWNVFSTANGQYQFYGNIYWLKFYQNDVLVRDLVPCRISRTGYLYDKVSGQLFGNETANSFLLGQDKDCVNLADYSSDALIGYYVNNTTGEITGDYRNFCSDYIPVEAGFDYYAAGANQQNHTFSRYNRLSWFDENKVFISGITSDMNCPCIDTSPTNARYVVFSCNIDGVTVTQSLVDSYDWFLNKMI